VFKEEKDRPGRFLLPCHVMSRGFVCFAVFSRFSCSRILTYTLFPRFLLSEKKKTIAYHAPYIPKTILKMDITYTVLPEQDLQVPASSEDSRQGFNKKHLVPAQLSAAVVCLTSLGSIFIAAQVIYIFNTQSPGDEGTSFDWSIVVTLYFFSLLESCLCFLALLICLILLFRSPGRVLTCPPHCCTKCFRCFLMLMFFVFTLYSILLPLLGRGLNKRIMPTSITCLVPCL
jgi:ABC-type transport system involved in multi-copper enzyme maturation permease subunit